MTPLEQALARHPFFLDFRPDHVAVLARCGREAIFDTGAFLFREGEPATAFFAVQRGRVALSSITPHEGLVTIQTVGDGDVLGWSWMLPPYRWQFGARAIEPTSVVAFDAACVRDALEQDHELGFHLMRRFAQVIATRLKATASQLVRAYEHRR